VCTRANEHSSPAWLGADVIEEQCQRRGQRFIPPVKFQFPLADAPSRGMLGGKQGDRRAVEDAVWSVMLKSDSALTGLEVSQRVAKELLEDIRAILNRLHKLAN